MRNALAGIRAQVRLLAAVVAAMLATCGGVAVSQVPLAQKPKDAWPDMPTYDVFTPEETRRDFVTMQFAKPLGRPELGFRVMIHKTWDEVPLTISKEEAANDDQGMVSLALLAGKEKGVRIEVAYCRVPPAIDMERWARAYLEGNRLELVHAQTGDFSGRRTFDTLVRTQGYLVRMTFSRHGDKIYLVSGSAPGALYTAWARHFGLAAVTFRTLNQPGFGPACGWSCSSRFRAGRPGSVPTPTVCHLS